MRFEEVFSFVRDKVLRGHLSDALETSVELSAIASQYPEPTRSIFYKTSIIYLASIIEATLHYCVLKLGFKHYRSDWEYKNVITLHEVGDELETEIISGRRIRKKLSLSGFIDFAVLNRFCRDKAKIYNDNFYKKIDRVRDKRNKIHLMRLSEIDRKYSKKDVDAVAEIANETLDIIESKIGR